jgi:hypothetical protein
LSIVFDLKRTHQLSLLPDKDLVNLCPPIEPYQVTKSRFSQDDVDEFIEKLTRFKIAFPHYQNYRAYGAVAGIEINEGVDRYAYQKGLFVIKPSGDTVAIINDADFQPNTW